MTTLTGRMLGRCYLEALIGEGSTARVYRGHHQTLGIPVAVKVLKQEGGGSLNPGHAFQERFRREAQLAARLSHNGIVRVLDFGEEMGLLYLVMELVDGTSLLDFLRRKGVLAPALALKVTGYLASALQAAHEQSIVHRDLKPSNILITKEGRLKISDLGLAKDLRRLDLTAMNTAVGTPTYMAPEAFRSGLVPDHRADFYALGVILYEMVYGRPPFTGDLNQVIAGHLHEEPAYSHGKVTVAPELLGLLKRLLDKDPAKRPADGNEVLNLTRRAQAALAGLPAAPAPAPRPDPGTETATRLSRFLEKRMGSKATEYQGESILHTTAKERFLVWALLAFFVGCVLAAFFFF